MRIGVKTFLTQAAPLSILEITVNAILAIPENKERAGMQCDLIMAAANRVWDTFHRGRGCEVLPECHFKAWQTSFDRIQKITEAVFRDDINGGFLVYVYAVLCLVDDCAGNAPDERRRKLWDHLAGLVKVLYDKLDPENEDPATDLGADIADEMRRIIRQEPPAMRLDLMPGQYVCWPVGGDEARGMFVEANNALEAAQKAVDAWGECIDAPGVNVRLHTLYREVVPIIVQEVAAA